MGDFLPIVISEGVSVDAPVRRLPVGAARSVAVEGLSVRSVVALGWSGPLPRLQPAEERVLPIHYGAPDSLCQIWGLRIPRAWHRANQVGPTTVLVTGGIGPEGPTDTLESYQTDGPSGERPRPLYEGAAVGHTATVLPDGRLLVAGGARPTFQGGDGARQRARLYLPSGEPDGGVLLLEGGPRALHADVVLGDGQVLLTGGCNRLEPIVPGQAPSCPATAVLASSVRYDREGAFVLGPTLRRPRFRHQAFALPDGRVLLVGGLTVDPMGRRLVPADEAEVLDPLAAPGGVGGTPAGQALAPAVLLPTGTLLWTGPGGAEAGGVLVPGGESVAVSPTVPRSGATLTALLDGTALLIGGRDATGALVGAVELYEGGRFRVLSDSLARIGHAALSLPDGTALVLGGLTAEGMPTPLVSRFVHALRVPDATPPPWPLPPEATGWIVAARPDEVTFDGEELRIDAAAPAEDRPRALALLGGVQWAQGELTVWASASSQASPRGGAALVHHFLNDRTLHFVRLVAEQPVALMRVRGQAVEAVPGCSGPPVAAERMGAGIAVSLRLRQGELAVALDGEPWWQCRPELPERGAVGFASLGGLVRFRAFALVRQ